MPLKIINVLKSSLADKSGIKAGDVILKINSNEINDFLDLQYHTSDPELEIQYQAPDGTRKTITIEHHWQKKLGLQPEAHRIKKCVNHCIFCFIDQMPPNQRKALYFKDDDYLFSFVYGNYISLSNFSDTDYQRIAEQRISPLYISIHSTNPDLRKKIMGYRKKQDVLAMLRWFSEKGISFHTQIVAMPGINDGEELSRTLNELADPDLNTLSIGIVPVGLTAYRDNLYPLSTYDKKGAEEVLAIAEEAKEAKGFREIYCADEFFLLAGLEIPDADYYDDYCQLENGIGMLRAARDNWRKNRKRFVKSLQGKDALFVTGVLAKDFMEEITADVNGMRKMGKCSLLSISNKFFGESVTVSGLLTYRDIKEELHGLESLPSLILLSSNMFNSDGLTLDGMSIDEIKEDLQRDVVVVDELWRDWS